MQLQRPLLLVPLPVQLRPAVHLLWVLLTAQRRLLQRPLSLRPCEDTALATSLEVSLAWAMMLEVARWQQQQQHQQQQQLRLLDVWLPRRRQCLPPPPALPLLWLLRRRRPGPISSATSRSAPSPVWRPTSSATSRGRSCPLPRHTSLETSLVLSSARCCPHLAPAPPLSSCATPA